VESGKNQYSLLTQRRFGPYFLTQFLGAFNDNVFKNALLLMIAFQSGGLFELSSDTLINLSAGLFILPFFLLSATAGQLADKYDKAGLIRKIKLLEIAIMLLAAIALWQKSLVALILLLFLMGTQSSLFGPVKYGILPQLLNKRELLGGNGLVETGTFLAILLGTAAGGLLIGIPDTGRLLVAGTVVVVACAGFASSLAMPPSQPVDPDLKINWNPVTETFRTMRYARQSRVIFLSIIGVSWFWFIGALYLAQLPNFTRIFLSGNEQVVTLLLAIFSIGISTGSLLCERLSGQKIDIGLVPFGSIGLTLFGLDLALQPAILVDGGLLGAVEWLQRPAAWRVCADILLLGSFGGFYIVPLYASIQHRTAPDHRARVIAANNVLNALFMVLAALLAIAVLAADYSIPQLFLLVAVLNAAVAIYIYRLAPEFVLRFVTWILVHLLYRIRIQGAQNIPAEGPVLLTCNHVSYVDALVIGGCAPRALSRVIRKIRTCWPRPSIKSTRRLSAARPCVYFRKERSRVPVNSIRFAPGSKPSSSGGWCPLSLWHSMASGVLSSAAQVKALCGDCPNRSGFESICASASRYHRTERRSSGCKTRLQSCSMPATRGNHILIPIFNCCNGLHDNP
jgi:MFS family permease